MDDARCPIALPELAALISLFSILCLSPLSLSLLLTFTWQNHTHPPPHTHAKSTNTVQCRSMPDHSSSVSGFQMTRWSNVMLAHERFSQQPERCILKAWKMNGPEDSLQNVRPFCFPLQGTEIEADMVEGTSPLLWECSNRQIDAQIDIDNLVNPPCVRGWISMCHKSGNTQHVSSVGV